MKTITIAQDVLENLEFVQGRDIHEKLSRLVENNLVLQLKECEELIFRFESKYGMDFENFATLWEEGGVKNRHRVFSWGAHRDCLYKARQSEHAYHNRGVFMLLVTKP